MGAEFGANGWNLPLCANLILTANLAWCVKFAFVREFGELNCVGGFVVAFLSVNVAF